MLPARVRPRVTLNICCGSGLEAEFFASRFGAPVVGTDISVGMLRNAVERARRGGYPFIAVCADSENLPFRSGSVDAAFVLHGLHHLAEPAAGLVEMARVSRDAVLVFEPASSPVRRFMMRIGVVSENRGIRQRQLRLLGIHRLRAAAAGARLRARAVQAGAVESDGQRSAHAQSVAADPDGAPGVRVAAPRSRPPLGDQAVAGRLAGTRLRLICMHIAFDTLSENPFAPSSAINFFVSFAETLCRVREPEDRWSVLVSPANRHLFEHAAADGVDLIECPVSNEHIIRRIAVQQTWLPGKLRRLGVDVILGYNVVPLHGVCARAVKISTLHHYETPRELARNPFRLYYRTFMFKAACARAEAVIANSTHTQDTLLRYMKLPKEKIYIVHEAVSDEFAAPHDRDALAAHLRSAHGLTPGYVLFASTIWRYKNLHTLVRAMTHLPPSLRLVAVGKNGDAPCLGRDPAADRRARAAGSRPVAR